MQSQTVERNTALDIVRMVAVLAVIMTHVSAGFVNSYDASSLEFVVGNIFDSLSRLGVPLFVMVSGALLLDERKTVTLRYDLFKKIKNIFLLILFWATVYALIYRVLFPLLQGETPSLREVLYAIAKGHYHIWYLYMILGLYLATPFLRSFAKKENKKLVLFFLLISLSTQFLLPVIEWLSLICEELAFVKTWVDMFYLQFFGGFAAYFLMGWYIVHIGFHKKWERRLLYALGLLSLLVIIVGTQLSKGAGNVYSNLGLPVFLYAASVFVALNSIKWKVKDRYKKWIGVISNMTFGVYIIHPLFHTLVNQLVPYAENPVLYIAASFLALVLLSFAWCWVASKIPLVKKSVRM